MVVSPGAIGSKIAEGIQYLGEASRLRTYTRSYSGTDYDQELVTQSGVDVWMKMIHYTVGKSSTDRDYLEQGVILKDDRKVFFAGSLTINSFMKLGLGSPIRNEYGFIAPAGVQNWSISGVSIFTEAYIRRLTNGSFIGEY